MAKKLLKKDEEIIIEEVEVNEEVFLVSKDIEEAVKTIVNEEVEVEEEIEEEEEVVVITPMEEVVNVAKRVRILPSRNHKCYVGGEWYYLVKGKQQNVPENVKNILLKAGVLSPL